MIELIDRLAEKRSLHIEEYIKLISYFSPYTLAYAAARADGVRRKIYGNEVFVRGLIEVSNYCKNDCYYCGIRRSNDKCLRYRLSDGEILGCCDEGYALGFRTFVLQGGEDAQFGDDRLCSLIAEIKRRYPDTAITLSLGERGQESYRRLREAGADRYLLRHETCSAEHYAFLHPAEQSFAYRMECLMNLKRLGFQVGCGFMVGSPRQTVENLAEELKFIEAFKPDMCGIGPFIPHKDTPFKGEAGGNAELTCFLLSLIRLIHPSVLLPATTALGTVSADGRKMGIRAGANVIMPNLSPRSVRKKYELYDNKVSDGEEAAECIESLRAAMDSIGYRVVTDRGDVRSVPDGKFNK